MNTTLKMFLSLMILNLSYGLAQDTQLIQLEPKVARLVVTDLLEGDKAKFEVKLLDQEVSLLKDKILVLDSILGKKDLIIGNYEQIIGTKDEQLGVSQKLSKKLQADLKLQKAKTKIFQMGSGAAVIAILALTLL
jgi:hypothetical protein